MNADRRFPPPLRRGARVGLVAPAGPVLDFHDLEAGLEALRRQGLHPVALRPFDMPHGYLSAPDEIRWHELETLWMDPSIEALFCVRGGYGTLRLLHRLEAVSLPPRLLIGYSDITALQWALLARQGIPSLSGPMVATDWPHIAPEVEALFWQLVGEHATPVVYDLKGMQSGQATGLLVGGNLTMITRLVGTPYLPDLTGAILFLEEVEEEPYRVDGLLAQLRLSGWLERLGGLVFGAFTRCHPRPDRPSFTVEEVLWDYARRLAIPVAGGLPYGHIPDLHPVPIGVHAHLQVEGEHARLTLLEPLVHPIVSPG